MKNKIFKLVLSSMLIAISIIVSRTGLLSPVLFSKTLRLDMAYGIIIFAGCVLGAPYGAAIGFLSDLLGALIFPIGTYYPGFTISYMLIGLIPGVLHGITKNKKYWYIYHFITVSVTCLITNILGTFWLKLYFGKVFGQLLYIRLAGLLVIIPVSFALSLLLINLYKRYYNTKKL